MVKSVYKIFTSYIVRGREDVVKKIILFPVFLLSFLYYFTVKMREILYRMGILRVKHLSCPVISVGNIVIGGSGKTTISIVIADFFSKRGKDVCVVCRSFGSFFPDGSQFVSIRGRILLDMEYSGDEPYLIASHLEKGSVIAGRRKWQSAEVALREEKFDLIVVDDGYQHLKLHRDINILILTGCELDSYLFPRGILREPLSSAARADIILINKLAGNSTDMRHYLERSFPEKPVFTFSYQIKGFLDASSNRMLEPGSVRGERVFLFSSIGDSGSFSGLIEKQGGIIEEFVEFPDHYMYKKGDLERIVKRSGGLPCFTTEKDWVKIKKYYSGEPRLFITMISVNIDPGFLNLIERLIDGNRKKSQENN